MDDEELDKLPIKVHWVYLGPEFKANESPEGRVNKCRKNCLRRSERVRQLAFINPEKFPPSAQIAASFLCGSEHVCGLHVGGLD